MAYTLNTAVIKAILAPWGGMQIKQHRKSIVLGPAHGVIYFFDTANERLNIAKHKVRHWQTHTIDAHTTEQDKIALTDVLSTVLTNTVDVIIAANGAWQIELIICI